MSPGCNIRTQAWNTLSVLLKDEDERDGRGRRDETSSSSSSMSSADMMPTTGSSAGEAASVHDTSGAETKVRRGRLVFDALCLTQSDILIYLLVFFSVLAKDSATLEEGGEIG